MRFEFPCSAHRWDGKSSQKSGHLIIQKALCIRVTTQLLYHLVLLTCSNEGGREQNGRGGVVMLGGQPNKAQDNDDRLALEIFRRDLNEVHLLMDFISSLPGKGLNDLRLPNP